MAHPEQSLCHALANTFSVVAQRLLFQGIVDASSIQLTESRAALIAAIALMAMPTGAVLDRLVGAAGGAIWGHAVRILHHAQ